MKVKNELQFSTMDVIYPMFFLLIMVIVFWAESRFNLNLNFLGIYPREIIGLRGIFFGPFIHGDSTHLFNNSIPFVVLTTALFYFYKNIRWKVLLYGLLLTGIFTWIIGRPSLHIGMSGIIYMLTAFLLFKGIFSRHYQLIALSFAVIFLYGSFIWYVFPIDPKISWEGHLSGFVVGFIFSIVFKNPTLKERKYEWEHEDYNPEDDAFLRQFDENGNFIEIPKEQEEIKEEQPIIIKYIFKNEDSKKNEEL